MNGKLQPSDQELKDASDKLERAKKQLQEAEKCWDDNNFIKALKKKKSKEKQKAFDLKLEIGTKLLEVENAQIALVVGRVKENSQQLESAITDLGHALQTLTDVTRILNAIGSLLSIVTKILALL
jgi:DNA repair exonuclease SbcCD ATPase subunit